MSQFDEFSSPSETAYVETETGGERHRTSGATGGVRRRYRARRRCSVLR